MAKNTQVRSDSVRRRQRVYSEQVRMLYGGLWQSASVTLLIAILLVVAMWSVVDREYLLTWLSAASGVSILRVWLAWRFRRQPPDDRERSRWIVFFAIGSTAAGALWGAYSLWLFPAFEFQHQVILVMALVGVAAGGAVTLAPLWPVAAAFLILTLLPLILQYLWLRGSLELIAAAMASLFLLFTLLLSWRWSRNLRENIRLQVEAGEREQVLRESENRYHAIFQASPLGMLYFDQGGSVTDCNDKLLKVCSASREQLLGIDMLASRFDHRVRNAVQHALSMGEGYFEGDVVISEKTLPLRVFFSGVRDRHAEIVGGVGVVEDLTERRRAEATIHRQTYYDSLTGLPNRRQLTERLERTLTLCARHGEHGAVLFIDLDRFKEVNESLGHAMGDRLLNATARRLTELLRDDDIAARVNSDEFVVVVGHLKGEREQVFDRVTSVAERIISALSEPYYLTERPSKVTPSIGFTLFNKKKGMATELLKQAETAMFQAKAEGRAGICGYLPSMQTAAVWRLTLEQDLRQALESNQLQLYFQPQVDSEGRIVGAEALLRWQHPKRGMIPPVEFIPVAEESGLILELGQWVMEQACQALRRFDASQLPRLSINISPRQFSQPDFVVSVEQCIERAGVEAQRLQLEITEGLMIDNLNETVETMRILKRIGVGLAIDDFGVGYSSLAYLKRLPLDELKIDRSFIQELENPNDVAIVKTVIAIARTLNLTVVAEGVETAWQRDVLEKNGCHIFQGYWFYRPLSVEAFATAIDERMRPVG